MHFKLLFCLFASSLAIPTLPGYNLPSPTNGGRLIIGSDGFRRFDDGRTNGGNLDVSFHGGSVSSCGDGQAINSDGSCAEAEVTRKIFVFQSPEQNFGIRNNQPITHKPKLNYNIVFVRTPEGPEGYERVVVPPAQQKTIVYVLNKEEENAGSQVIEIPEHKSHAPEVFYVNYREGDNPQLPIGVDLQTALASATTEQGQLLIGGGGGGSIGLGSNFRTSSAGGFGSTISGGSASFVNGQSGGFVSGNGGFRSGVSGGSISVGTGGIVGLANNRGISREYAPPNPSTVYGTPFRN